MKFDISYSLKLALPVMLWGVICIAFMTVALLNVGVFSESDKSILTSFSIAYIVFNLSFLFLKTSRFSAFALPQSKSMSKNISYGKLLQKLGPEKVSETFISFYKYSKKCFTFSVINIIIFTLSLVIWQFAYGNPFNITIIVLLGFLIGSLLSGFAVFVPQLQFFSIAKQCRDYLSKKGRCPIESNFPSIKTKLFFIIIFLIDFLILFALTEYTSQAIGFNIFFTGLFMIIFTTLVLILYLDKAFEDFFMLTKSNLEEDLLVFSTGSLDKEFVNLTKFLNEMSIQLYFFKEKTRNSEKEMMKRMEELEKFFEATIGREERMIQLKKENAELRQKLERIKKN